MRVRRLALVALVGLLVLGACSGDDGDRDPIAGATTTSTTAPASVGDAREGPGGFRPDPIAWRDCAAMDCASVEVPLDYAHPEGKHIELSVVRVKAKGDRIGPLFVNPGGPGGSAQELASALPILAPDEIAERFDIVAVEPRGVEGSAPFSCGIDYKEMYSEDPTVEDAADRDRMIATAARVAQGCKDGAGDELAHIGTRDVARDMDAVRAAMGDAQMSYFGISYGTANGQEYADLFPHRVRAMVLDGVVELGKPGLELAAEQAAGFEVALRRFADSCKALGCQLDDPIAAVEQVQAKSERPGGIPAPDADRPAGPGEVDLGIAQALYSQQLWSSLDAALAHALDGDGSLMVELADQYVTAGDFDVYFAVSCVDYAWPSGDPDAFLSAAKDAAKASPHFGEALVTDYLRCVDWPVPPDPLTPVAAKGAPPILVVSTTGDPATPYESGVAVAEGLESGVLLTNDGEGHGGVIGGNDCTTEHFRDYLVDLTVPKDGTRCR
jgi:pimeloyl-ACP methyl ester carboxylesterase